MFVVVVPVVAAVAGVKLAVAVVVVVLSVAAVVTGVFAIVRVAAVVVVDMYVIIVVIVVEGIGQYLRPANSDGFHVYLCLKTINIIDIRLPTLKRRKRNISFLELTYCRQIPAFVLKCVAHQEKHLREPLCGRRPKK